MSSERVGFGKRFAALLIDAVLITIFGTITGLLLGGLLAGAFGALSFVASLGHRGAASAGAFGGFIIGAILGTYAFSLLYGLLEALHGASLGKIFMGIMIANPDASRAGVGKLLFRYALKNINALCSLAAGITGLIFLQKLGEHGGAVIFLGCFLALGPARRALHDRIASTAVYQVKDVW